MADAGNLKGELERRQVNVLWTCRRFFLGGFRGVPRNPSVLDTQMDTDFTTPRAARTRPWPGRARGRPDPRLSKGRRSPGRRRGSAWCRPQVLWRGRGRVGPEVVRCETGARRPTPGCR